MKKVLILFLALALTACLSPSGGTAPQTVELTSTPEATVTATMPPTPTAAATEIPFAALPPEEQAALYLAGKIQDVSELNFEQQKAFSLALNEQRNELDGPHSVTYTDESGKILYLGPDGKFHPEPQNVEKRKPKVFDDEGYIHVFDNGTWVKIAGSNKIQFDDFNNFPWPAGEPVDPQWVTNKDLLGLTIPEYNYSYGRDSMIPIFFPKKEVGEIDIVGYGYEGSVIGYVMNENDSFSAIATIIIGRPVLFGDNFRADSSNTITEQSAFFKKLETNTLYYLMYETNQKERFATGYPASGGQEITANYTGLAPTHQTHDVITGKLASKNLVIIRATLVVEASQQPDN